jgi:plasmid stabilization system protein ParE
MAEVIWPNLHSTILTAIADYIALDNPEAARLLAQKIFDHIDHLESHPRLGSIPEELKGWRYRQIVEPPCRIFYRGGNVRRSGEWVNVQPLDSFRKRVYLAPVGLWLILDAGTLERVSLNTRTKAVRISLSPADSFTPHARLRVQQPARIASVGTYAPRTKLLRERDAFTIPLRRLPTSIELRPKP